jgi:hypothetical protein
MEEKIRVLSDIGVDVSASCRLGIFERLADKNGNLGPTEEEKATAQEEWMQMYDQLKDYKEKSGLSLPPVSPYTPLVKWVKRQRNEYQRLIAGKTSDMTAQRIHYLNEIQFPFIPTIKQISWDDRYEELKLYKEKHGNVAVPAHHPGKNCIPSADISLFFIIFFNSKQLAFNHISLLQHIVLDTR